jgi:DNA-binding LytR/AlgR family response regulator
LPLKNGNEIWIQASVGTQLRFIDVNEVRNFRADAKYTRVDVAKFEAHIRTTIKDLALQLDTDKFWQISRSTIVNVAKIDAVQHIDHGLALRLMQCDEWQSVSQNYRYRFR